MSKTVEDIAREAAERYWNTPIDASTNIHSDLRKIIASAIEEAFQQVPVPGPVSEERLAMFRSWKEKAVGERIPLFIPEDDVPANCTGIETLAHGFIQLLEQVDHLTRCLHDCGEDGSLKQWSAGYRAAQEKYEAELTKYKKEVYTYKNVLGEIYDESK